MQSKLLRRLTAHRSSHQLLLAAGSLVALAVAASSCAAELEDPDKYTVAQGSSGAPPTLTGGTTGQGGSNTVTGGTKSGSGGTATTGGAGPGTTGGSGTGTGGSATGTGGAQGNVVTMDPCVKTLIQNQCAICHFTAAKAMYGDLDLSGADNDIIARLLDVPATNKGVSNPGSCKPGSKLIDSNNPADSVMLKRVSNTHDCGGPMPFAPGLSGANLTCMQTWIMKF